MEQKELKRLLEEIASGQTDIDSAMLKLKLQPFEDLGFAKIDHHRGIRQGAAEVIYGAGKTPEQIAEIAERLRSAGQETVLITRMSAEAAEIVGGKLLLRRKPL